MCEFCVKHGDGKKWYLNAANYAKDLLEDIHRQKYIEDFIPEVSTNAARWLKIMDRGLKMSPYATRRISKIESRRMKKIHFGQVLCLEDVRAIMGIVRHVVRLPCICREVLLKKEEAVCYLLAASPDKLGFQKLIGRREEAGPYVAGMEKVEPGRALSEMAALEDKGLIHTVWTFITPFIGTICNCDPHGCLAMNFTSRGLRLYLPGEEKVEVDSEKCVGCGNCVEICLFSALTLDNGTARIDEALCHGCGICRRSCQENALSLKSPKEAITTGNPAMGHDRNARG